MAIRTAAMLILAGAVGLSLPARAQPYFEGPPPPRQFALPGYYGEQEGEWRHREHRYWEEAEHRRAERWREERWRQEHRGEQRRFEDWRR